MNAVWTLRNLLYKADEATKAAFYKWVSFDRLAELINDSEPGIQEKALAIVQNLAFGSENDTQYVFNGFGVMKLIEILENKLVNPIADVVSQALQVLVVLTAGSEEHKTSIMSSAAIILALLHNITSSNVRLCEYAVWCLVNLTFLEENKTSTGVRERLRQLSYYGFEDALKSVVNHPASDVREKIKAALQNLLLLRETLQA